MKPRLGLEAYRGGRDNNIVFQLMGSILKDESEPDPDRRFKMVMKRIENRREACGAAYSPDGIHWNEGPVLDLPDLASHPDIVALVKDDADPDPQRRFRLVWQKQHPADKPGPKTVRAKCMAFGPDVEHWTASSHNPVLSPPAGYLTAAALAGACEDILAAEGIGKTLSILESLMDFGFKKTVEAGPSMTPFMAGALTFPPKPETDAPEDWESFRAEAESIIRETTDLFARSPGAQILSVLSGARGSVEQLIHLTCWAGNTEDSRLIHPIRHGKAEGLAFDEFVSMVFQNREMIHLIVKEIFDREPADVRSARAGDHPVFSRARTSSRPGIVFARAAQKGEKDPLKDPQTRLFAGLHPMQP